MTHGKFYGSTVVGERGQVVIPAEAREELDMKPGQKLLVLGGRHRGMVILFKADLMSRFADMMFRRSRFFEEMFRGYDREEDDAQDKYEGRSENQNRNQNGNQDEIQDEDNPDGK